MARAAQRAAHELLQHALVDDVEGQAVAQPRLERAPGELKTAAERALVEQGEQLGDDGPVPGLDLADEADIDDDVARLGVDHGGEARGGGVPREARGEDRATRGVQPASTPAALGEELI
ncbi:MAG: hypothetical protein IPN01_12220 [Deltaproteobacteria bacterium]|nr:hypothetical protein [Deltaproteobacteria bacterium]